MNNDTHEKVKAEDPDLDAAVMKEYHSRITNLQTNTDAVLAELHQSFLSMDEEHRRTMWDSAECVRYLRSVADLIEQNPHMIMSVNIAVIEATTENPMPKYHQGMAGDKSVQFMTLQNELIGCSMRVMEGVREDVQAQQTNPDSKEIH